MKDDVPKQNEIKIRYIHDALCIFIMEVVCI